MKVIVTILAVGSLAAGTLAPVASGQDSTSEPTAVERLVRQEDARRNDLALGITRITPAVITEVPPPPRLEVVARDGFDWLDALVGAATGVAVLVALGGATVAVRSRALRHA